ncbi:hypothetical protein HELRODRAFT_162843 [Helobdella robusta]|uniref:Uncharacterized protein n=1 Tax=Helobdella robusta TaxID=6412 RepID=T1ET92_HELRO|nr:hypothetical protein HELRODRAFT_162843 [Helobdella robusta]ESN99320.1 hypothetical protein HELRODRAFT_162843 [Helobdella robusta]
MRGDFLEKEQNLSYYEEDVKFFQHQLDLYAKLAYGRNDFSIFVITRELGILTWDEAFLSLRSHMLPDSLRAKYCELIIALFIDVGTNYSVLDHTNLSFIYEDVLAPGPNNDGEYVRNKLSACANWISPEGPLNMLIIFDQRLEVHFVHSYSNGMLSFHVQRNFQVSSKTFSPALVFPRFTLDFSFLIRLHIIVVTITKNLLT